MKWYSWCWQMNAWRAGVAMLGTSSISLSAHFRFAIQSIYFLCLYWFSLILIAMCHLQLFRDSWLLCCIVSLMARYVSSVILVIISFVFFNSKCALCEVTILGNHIDRVVPQTYIVNIFINIWWHISFKWNVGPGWIEEALAAFPIYQPLPSSWLFSGQTSKTTMEMYSRSPPTVLTPERLLWRRSSLNNAPTAASGSCAWRRLG